MAAAAFRAEEGHGWISLAAISRARDGHLSRVNSVSVAEENDDVAIENIPAGIEREGWVRTEIDSIASLRRRKWKIDTAPIRSAVRRKITTHRQAEDFV